MSSYLQLRIGCVYQSYTAGASLGKALICLSSLDAVDFILRALITFKICHIPSSGWAMVTKIIHQLKLLQLSKFDDRSPTMALVVDNDDDDDDDDHDNELFLWYG